MVEITKYERASALKEVKLLYKKEFECTSATLKVYLATWKNAHFLMELDRNE
tara:strand:- start:389 stop:544 length:156 start_codon:yes stop_codon:yes gene_type:complete